MQETEETQVGSLGREDPLEKETATHSSIHLENPMDSGAWGRKKLDTTEQLSTHAWGSEWEMPTGLSCYIFCFNLTVLHLDWSLELPLLDSTWEVQICSYQRHKNTFENKWRVAQESLETSWVSRCTFLFKEKFSVALELKGKRNGVWSVEQEICSRERKYR